MAEKVNHNSTDNYDDDVSKRLGFQTQIDSSNPSSNPYWSPPQGQSIQSPSAPLPVSAGHYVGPNLQPANQLPHRDNCLECARCSVCFVMFGVFFVVVGIITLATAFNLDVGPHWIGPQPTNPLRVIGPIFISLGISLLVLFCIVISIAKHRVTTSSQNTGYVASNFEAPQPVVSGGIGNRNNHVLTSQCHDYEATNFAFDSPPSYDTVTSVCDSSPSTTRG